MQTEPDDDSGGNGGTLAASAVDMANSGHRTHHDLQCPELQDFQHMTFPQTGHGTMMLQHAPIRILQPVGNGSGVQHQAYFSTRPEIAAQHQQGPIHPPQLSTSALNPMSLMMSRPAGVAERMPAGQGCAVSSMPQQIRMTAPASMAAPTTRASEPARIPELLPTLPTTASGAVDRLAVLSHCAFAGQFSDDPADMFKLACMDMTSSSIPPLLGVPTPQVSIGQL
jgi:hypothetical protein